MTITNRDYNSSLEDKKSQEFQNLAEEVHDNVNNALKDLKGFYSSEVEKFREANSVNCQLKILVREDSDITKETIKVSLENSSGNLTLTNVTVVDTEMATTMAVTDKKTPTKPTEKTMTQRPTKDDVVFEVTAKIPKEKYTDELGNVSSAEFNRLSKDVAEVLNKIFDGKLPGFLSVEVVRFRRGSIICTFNLRTKRESTVSEKDIKEVLTDASDEISKYTFKDIEVERKTTKTTTGPYETSTRKSTEKGAVEELTKPQENNWPAWATAIIAVFGVLLLVIFIIIYVVRIMQSLSLYKFRSLIHTNCLLAKCVRYLFHLEYQGFLPKNVPPPMKIMAS